MYNMPAIYGAIYLAGRQPFPTSVTSAITQPARQQLTGSYISSRGMADCFRFFWRRRWIVSFRAITIAYSAEAFVSVVGPTRCPLILYTTRHRHRYVCHEISQSTVCISTRQAPRWSEKPLTGTEQFLLESQLVVWPIQTILTTQTASISSGTCI